MKKMHRVVQVNVRLTTEEMRAVEAERAKMVKAFPGLPVANADVLRIALTHYLAGRK
jgi:hypothetical protein